MRPGQRSSTSALLINKKALALLNRSEKQELHQQSRLSGSIIALLKTRKSPSGSRSPNRSAERSAGPLLTAKINTIWPGAQLIQRRRKTWIIASRVHTALACFRMTQPSAISLSVKGTHSQANWWSLETSKKNLKLVHLSLALIANCPKSLLLKVLNEYSICSCKNSNFKSEKYV